MIRSPLDRRLGQARRRLAAAAFGGRLVANWAVALGLAAGWIRLAPFAVERRPPWLALAVLAGLAGAATLAAVWRSLRRIPTRLDAARALDARFGLAERATTAVGLSAGDRASPVGTALLADADARVEKLKVRSKFPIWPGRSAVLLPVEVGLIVALLLLEDPALPGSSADARAAAEKAAGGPAADAAADGKKPIPKVALRPVPERPGKSDDVRELEAMLEKLYGEAKTDDARAEKPEAARAKVEKVASLEEAVKKLEAEQVAKLGRIQEQMQKLTSLEKGPSDEAGPAKDLHDALAETDLDKAKDAIEGLRKKARDKALDAKDAEQLKKQADDLAKKLDRLAKSQDEQDKLKDLIEKAKAEGRDSDSLERELKDVRDKAAKQTELKNLADKFGEVKKALDKDDSAGAAEKLGEMSRQLDGLKDQAQDAEDLETHRKNLRDIKKSLADQAKSGDDGELQRERAGGAAGDKGEPGDDDRGKGRSKGGDGADELTRPKESDGGGSGGPGRAAGRWPTRGSSSRGTSGPWDCSTRRGRRPSAGRSRGRRSRRPLSMRCAARSTRRCRRRPTPSRACRGCRGRRRSWYRNSSNDSASRRRSESAARSARIEVLRLPADLAGCAVQRA